MTNPPTGADLPTDLPADPDELRAVALRIAVTASELVRTRRRAGFGIATKSTATDMVTDVDRASDALIRELLADARPDDAVVTEEDEALGGTTGITWYADPIDGTTNFVYDHSPYTVSIAATVGGHPVAGAVVEVRTDDRYDAALGGGARRNGEPMRLADPPPLARALVATGFGYDPDRRRAQAAVVQRVVGDLRDIRRLGAASFDLCGVAAQRVDAYYEIGLGPWDIAAGWLIAAEAGATVEHLAGGGVTLGGGSVIAAHPDLVGPLRDLLANAGVGDVP